jgi:hypothetical protein
METRETHFTCPYCWETISMVLDASVEEQLFVEDCEVCCRPIEVRYRASEGEIAELEIERAQ